MWTGPVPDSLGRATSAISSILCSSRARLQFFWCPDLVRGQVPTFHRRLRPPPSFSSRPIDRPSEPTRTTDRQAGRHQRAKTVTNSLLFSCSPRLRAPLCLRPRPKQNTVNHTTSALSLSCWLSVCVHLHLSATKTKSCQIHYERTLALRACTTSVCDQNKSRSFDKANTL